eukprot:s130_g20.t2
MRRLWALLFILDLGTTVRHTTVDPASDLDDLEDGKWPFSSEPHDKTVQQAAKTATEQGKVKALQQLRDHDIPLDRKDHKQRSLLFNAVEKKQLGSLRFLLKILPADESDKYGKTPAMVTIEKNCTECLLEIMNVGIDPNEQVTQEPRSSADALQLLHERGASLETPALGGRRPAHVAVLRAADDGRQSLIRLGKLGARLDLRDSAGRTPAHLACDVLDEELSSKGENVTEILQTLLKFGADLGSRDAQGRTPAHYCAVGHQKKNYMANPKALDFLYKVVPDSVFVKDDQGKTPQQLAEEGHTLAQVFFSKVKVEQTAKTCNDLAHDVRTLFDCRPDTIHMPPGFVVHGAPFCAQTCAAKCPNYQACPGSRVLTVDRSCALGYAVDSMGCSRCEPGFGRSNQDPFVCGSCGDRRWLLWTVHALKPVIFYWMSMRSASKCKTRQSAVLKILLSFGAVAASLWPTVRNSEVYDTMPSITRGLIITGDVAAASTTQWHGPSLDCLLNETGSMFQWLLMTALIPVMLLVVSFVGACLRSENRHAPHLLLPCLVLANCFLPDLMAAFSRFMPCMHFQTDGRLFRSYEPWLECDESHLLTRALIGTTALLIGTLTGPGLWMWLIRQARGWSVQEREEWLGYLTSGYKEHVLYWEAGVLSRKCGLVMATSLFPMSYSPLLFLTAELIIITTSLVCHAYTQPYEDDFLNMLELSTLVASTLAIQCTLLIKLQPVDWTLDVGFCAPVLALLIVALLAPFCLLVYVFIRDRRLDAPRDEQSKAPDED